MKKWLKIALGILFTTGVIVLLISANQSNNSKVLQEPTIDLEVQNGVPLITESELLRVLKTNRLYREGILKSELDIYAIENFLDSLNEIQSADVFLSLGNEWSIKVKTKLPVARIVMNRGEDFYIDSRQKLMRLSPYSKPKILAFTGMETVFQNQFDLDRIINNDSLKTIFKLDEIYRISSYVCNDAFYDAQIVQVHYDREDGFVLIPRVGEHKIIFGSANSEEQVKQKFEKLTTFYEDVIPYEGWNKYKSINLKYENQIVAKKK
jgi:cell division protein FtsQ